MKMLVTQTRRLRPQLQLATLAATQAAMPSPPDQRTTGRFRVGTPPLPTEVGTGHYTVKLQFNVDKMHKASSRTPAAGLNADLCRPVQLEAGRHAPDAIA